MSCYVDGVFSDKIDKSISAKQSEQLVIMCALCGSVYQKSEIKCDTCKVNLRASQKRNLPDVQVNTGKSKKSRVHEKEIVFNVQANYTTLQPKGTHKGPGSTVGQS